MNERDELAKVIAAADGSGHFLRNGRRYAYGPVADAILAAGYRRPRKVTTPEELAALPVGSVVLDRDGDSYQLKGEQWWLAGFGDDFNGHEIALPATVVYEPLP